MAENETAMAGGLRDLLVRALEAEEALRVALEGYERTISRLPRSLVCVDEDADGADQWVSLVGHLREHRTVIHRELRRQEMLLLRRM